MNYRIAEILAAVDLGTAGVKTVDIDSPDVISRLEILFKATNGDDGCDAHPASNITKIELIDGSDVLESISGRQCQALNYYNRKETPYNVINGVIGEMMIATFGIDFGRYLYDTEFAFDPSKFVNPQLKITWDEDVANTSCTVNDCRVFAHIFDERRATPRGFLMNKEHYTYTPTASQYEYIDLPTDYKMRMLMIRAFKDTLSPYEVADKIRINENNQKRLPWDGATSDYQKFTNSMYPKIVEQVRLTGLDAGANFYVTPSYDVSFAGLQLAEDKTLSKAAGALGHKQLVHTETADAAVEGLVQGYMPHHCIAFPFGIQETESDWYDVTRIESLKLRIKAGSGVSTDSTIEIVTQQPRGY